MKKLFILSILLFAISVSAQDESVNGNLYVTGNATANSFTGSLNGNWNGQNISNVLFKGGNSSDWNLSITNGIHRKWGGANNPFGTSHATLLNIGQDDGASWGFQLASRNSILKFRGFSQTGTFNQWYDIYHSGNFNKTVLDGIVPAISYTTDSNTFTPTQTFDSGIRLNDGTDKYASIRSLLNGTQNALELKTENYNSRFYFKNGYSEGKSIAMIDYPYTGHTTFKLNSIDASGTTYSTTTISSGGESIFGGNINIGANSIKSSVFSDGIQDISLRGTSGSLSYISLADGSGYPWNNGFGFRTSDSGKGIHFSVGNVNSQLSISNSEVISRVNFRTNNIVSDSYSSNTFIDLDDDQTENSNMLSLGSVGVVNYLADTNNNNTGALHRWYKGTGDTDNATMLMELDNNGDLNVSGYITSDKGRIIKGTTSDDTADAQIIQNSNNQDILRIRNDGRTTLTGEFIANNSRSIFNGDLQSQGNLNLSGYINFNNSAKRIIDSDDNLYFTTDANDQGNHSRMWIGGNNNKDFTINAENYYFRDLASQNLFTINGTESTFNQNMIINGINGKGHFEGGYIRLNGNTNVGGNEYPAIKFQNAQSSWSVGNRIGGDFALTDGSNNNFVFRAFKGSNTSSLNIWPTQVAVNDNGIDLDFRVESDSNTHAFFVEGSSGDIGIGTHNPDAPIHINQSGSEALRFDRSGHNSYKLYLGGTKGLYFKNFTDDRDELVFDGNGNIGIGTPSPQAKFDVLGNALGLTTNSETMLANFRSSAGTSNLSALKILNRRNGDGNNWEKTSLRLQRFIDNVPTGYIDFGIENKSYDYGLAFGTGSGSNPQTRMVIDKTGNVGIGTMNPNSNAKLHIKGEEYLESGNINFITSSTDNSGTTGIKANPNGWTRLDPNGSRFLMPVTSGDVSAKRNILDIENTNDNWNRLMSLKADGSGFFMGGLSIGTSNLGSWKLAVNGNVRAKEIKVETGWSDFVFYKDYDLPTLAEVEQHIKEKGHLKDIPSAEEVEKNGIFLGDMNAKLLQKIEELTLYTIQQQKELDKEKSKNNALEKRLLKLENLIKEKLK